MNASLSRLAGRLLVAALVLMAAVGSLAIVAGSGPWSLLRMGLAIAVPVAAWRWPAFTLAALLAALPFFGNRPGTPQFLWLAWLSSLAVVPWLLRLVLRDRALVGAVAASPVGLAVIAYGAVSVLSLASVPFDELHEAYELPAGAGGLLQVAPLVARADILDLLYPLLTVLLTLQAIVVAFTAGVAIRREPRVIRLLAGGLLAGLALAVAAGLLDFHHLIDLRRLRAFDPVTNASGVLRLQSTFGHSGWFAEYVCFTLPSVLLLTAWPGRASWRLFAAATAFVATTLAVVLSSQRGGWITCAVLLPIVGWTAVRLVRRDGTANRWLRWRIVGPAVIALAGVTLVVSALAVASSARGVGPATGLVDRIRYVTQVSDRSVHVTAGLRLGALLPVLGGGSESFAMRYQEEYLRAGGRYYQRGYSPLANLYGSAHNVFAQTFAGKGTAGLVTLVLIVVAAGLGAWRVVRQPLAPADTLIAAYVSLSGLVAFVVYGQVQEVFYIHALQVVVFTLIGLAAGLEEVTVEGTPSTVLDARVGRIALALAGVLALHLVQAYVVPGRLGEAFRDRQISRAGDRLLPPEQDEAGAYFQWTGASAFITVPRTATWFAAEFRSTAPFPQTIELRFDGRPIDRLVLDAGAWRPVRYGAGSIWTLPRRVEVHVTPAWQPPGATRPLGVMVRRIDWRLPEAPGVR